MLVTSVNLDADKTNVQSRPKLLALELGSARTNCFVTDRLSLQMELSTILVTDSSQLLDTDLLAAAPPTKQNYAQT